MLKEVTIALVGKYTRLEDAYASVIKALQHASMACNHRLNLKVHQVVIFSFCLLEMRGWHMSECQTGYYYLHPWLLYTRTSQLCCCLSLSAESIITVTAHHDRHFVNSCWVLTAVFSWDEMQTRSNQVLPLSAFDGTWLEATCVNKSFLLLCSCIIDEFAQSRNVMTFPWVIMEYITARICVDVVCVCVCCGAVHRSFRPRAEHAGGKRGEISRSLAEPGQQQRRVDSRRFRLERCRGNDPRGQMGQT